MKRLSITHPEAYQGQVYSHRHYFEGWYLKHVTIDGDRTLSIIPGVSYTKTDTHAFIQVIENVTHQAYYFRFPINSFSYNGNQFDIRIGENHFSSYGISLAIHEGEFNLDGEIHYEQLTPIKKHPLSPTIMGPLAYLPGMECIHGIVSMSHQLRGSLTFNGQPLVFDGGKGYIEKDWGKSFPESYQWIHSNHFRSPSTSLVASLAVIPYLKMKFRGFFVNLQHEGNEYRFATYTGARLLTHVDSLYQRTMTITQGNYQLILIAYLDQHQSTRLAAPKNGEMTKGIKEGLSGHVQVILKDGKTVILDDIGMHAGIEFVDHLLD